MVKRFRYQTIPTPLHFLELPKHVLSWYISEIQFGAKLAIGRPRLWLVDFRQSWSPIGRFPSGSSLLLSCHETLGSSPALRQIWNCLKALIWYLKLISYQSFQHCFLASFAVWIQFSSNSPKFVSVPICWSDLLWKFWTSNFALIWWNDLLWNPRISILVAFSRFAPDDTFNIPLNGNIELDTPNQPPPKFFSKAILKNFLSPIGPPKVRWNNPEEAKVVPGSWRWLDWPVQLEISLLPSQQEPIQVENQIEAPSPQSSPTQSPTPSSVCGS